MRDDMATFWDASIRFDLLMSETIGEFRTMDRVTEKLKQAAGVVARSNASLEAEADRLIAREEEFEERKRAAFEPHHTLLDGRHRQMDQLEDSLKIVSNADPLQDSGDGLPEVKPEEPPFQPGETL